MKEQAVNIANQIMSWLATTGVSYAMDVLAAIIILLVGIVLIRILNKVLTKMLIRPDGRHALASRFIVSVLVKTAWAFLAIIILSKLGVNVGPLIAGLGVTGFILGFAFQESLGSLASGLMIAINEPFKVGDYVTVAGLEGTVTALDMMAVTLATADNRRVTIPNKTAWGSPITNYSALDTRRVDVNCAITYGTDVALARKTAIAALAAVPKMLATPAPIAEITALDAGSVALTVRGWSANADYWDVLFAANQAVKEAFARAGIDVPVPKMDVTVAQKN